MTFCAGWKYNGSVFLVADTAVTKSEKPRLEYSSFGQLHSDTKAGYVQEGLIKLIPISKGIAIGFSGDVQVALEIIELLKDNVAYAKSASDLIRFADSMGPFDPKSGVELLIASSSADGNNELIKWDTEKGADQSNANYYQIGSLVSYHAYLPPFLMNEIAKKRLETERVLPTITSVIQSYGMQENLVQMNIGGLIFGLYTSFGKVSWQEDTNYVLYSQNSTNPLSYISAIARDNVLIVNSSVTNDTRIFFHSVSEVDKTINTPEWREKVQEQFQSDRFRYWAFLSIKERIVVLLTRTNLDEKSKLVNLSHLGGGKFNLAINPWLESHLQQPLTNRNNSKIPFRVIQCIE